MRLTSGGPQRPHFRHLSIPAAQRHQAGSRPCGDVAASGGARGGPDAEATALLDVKRELDEVTATKSGKPEVPAAKSDNVNHACWTVTLSPKP